MRDSFRRRFLAALFRKKAPYADYPECSTHGAYFIDKHGDEWECSLCEFEAEMPREQP